jgi:hypothetical protein
LIWHIASDLQAKGQPRRTRCNKMCQSVPTLRTGCLFDEHSLCATCKLSYDQDMEEAGHQAEASGEQLELPIPNIELADPDIEEF